MALPKNDALLRITPASQPTPTSSPKPWERILHGLYLIWLCLLLAGGASWIDASLRQGNTMVAVFLPLLFAAMLLVLFLSRQAYQKAHQALLQVLPVSPGT